MHTLYMVPAHVEVSYAWYTHVYTYLTPIHTQQMHTYIMGTYVIPAHVGSI